MSAAGEDLERHVNGTSMTLAQMEAFVENVSGLSVRGQRALQQRVAQYRRTEEQRRDGRVTAAGQELLDRRDNIREEMEELDAETRRVRREARRGTLTPEQAKKALSAVGAGIRTARQRSAQLDSDLAALRTLAETDPADLQADLIARYPALGKSLPTLSADDLR